MEPQPSETTLQPAPPLVPPKPKNNSFLIILLSVLLLLATALAFFFALQTQKLTQQLTQLQTSVSPSPTLEASVSPTPTASRAPNGNLANWKTYYSQKYNYSFNFPQGWSISTPDKDNVVEFTIVAPPEADPYEGISVAVYSTGNQTLLLDWYKNNILKNYPSGTTLEKLGIKETNFLGEKALTNKNGTFFVQKDGYIYNIGWLHSGVTDTKNIKATFDQILSTFRFTE